MHHTIWRVNGQEATALVDAFAGCPRCILPTATTAPRARRGPGPKRGTAEADTFIAVAFPSSQMHILPYNRTVKDLAGQTPAQFLANLRARVTVRDGSPTPRGKGEVAMYLDGKWYALDLSGAAPADGSRASALDVALLQHHVLEPLLKIGDVRTDKRIDFVGGARGTSALEKRRRPAARRRSPSRCIP